LQLGHCGSAQDRQAQVLSDLQILSILAGRYFPSRVWRRAAQTGDRAAPTGVFGQSKSSIIAVGRRKMFDAAAAGSKNDP